MLATGGVATAQADLDFKAANIDHVSVQVVDLQRSVEFYQKMFGFSMVSQEQPRGIVRLGNGRVLVSLNNGSPAPRIDHFAIGIPRFTRESGMRYFTQRGATPLEGDYAGFHIKDPDGITCKFLRRDYGVGHECLAATLRRVRMPALHETRFSAKDSSAAALVHITLPS
jgi:catechol 2,3-dioxygenase-like lactoylglutathione lyase family enzyme